MNATSIFSKDFLKAVGGYLKAECSTGSAVTRPQLAKEIRKLYGRKLNYTDLNMWLSASVNLGLFNTDGAEFITKRGVGGGIVMVGATAEVEEPAPAPRKARKPARKAAKAAPAPVQETQAAAPVAQA